MVTLTLKLCHQTSLVSYSTENRSNREVRPKRFTSDISRETKERDMLLNEARKSQLESDWTSFKQAKNKLTEVIRSTRQAYFKNKFSENKNNHDCSYFRKKCSWSELLAELDQCLSKDDEEKQFGITDLSENEEHISNKTTFNLGGKFPDSSNLGASDSYMFTLKPSSRMYNCSHSRSMNLVTKRCFIT